MARHYMPSLWNVLLLVAVGSALDLRATTSSFLSRSSSLAPTAGRSALLTYATDFTQMAYDTAVVNDAPSERLAALAGLLEDLVESPNLASAPGLQARIAGGLQDVESLLSETSKTPASVSVNTAPNTQSATSGDQSWGPGSWDKDGSSATSVFGASFTAAPPTVADNAAPKTTSSKSAGAWGLTAVSVTK